MHGKLKGKPRLKVMRIIIANNRQVVFNRLASTDRRAFNSLQTHEPVNVLVLLYFVVYLVYQGRTL